MESVRLTIERFQVLQKAVEKAKRESDRLSGALEQTKRRLKDEHGCKSIKEAETKLKELESKEAKLTKELERELTTFQAKWGEKL